MSSRAHIDVGFERKEAVNTPLPSTRSQSFVNLLWQITDYFISGNVRTGSKEGMVRARAMVGVSITISLTHLGLAAVICLIASSFTRMVAMNILIGATVLLSPFLLRWGKSLYWATTYFCVLLYLALMIVMFHEDGVVFISSPWLAAFPLFAIYMLGVRTGAFFTALVIVSSMVVYWCHQEGYIISQMILPPPNGYAWLIFNLTAVVILLFVGGIYAISREKMIKESEERKGRLAALIQGTNDSICSMDTDLRLTMHNDSFANTIGTYAGGKVGAGMPFLDLLPQDKRGLWLQRCQDVLGGERVFLEQEYLYDEATYHTELSLSPIVTMGDVIGITCISRDITERRKAEEHLRKTDKLAAIGQLAAGLAHEINNPLAVIVGFAQGLEKRVPDGDRFHLPITSILREAVRCSCLVKELLTFSRNAKMPMESINLNEIVESSMVLLESHARMQDIQINCELNPGIQPVRGNRMELQQVLINLGTNAIDATRAGGIVTIRAKQNGMSGVSLEVGDTGEGIPNNILNKVFDPFFTTKEPGKGTGLGLSLVHEFVQQHGGDIEIVSEDGQGTTVRVSLPIQSSNGEATA